MDARKGDCFVIASEISVLLAVPDSITQLVSTVSNVISLSENINSYDVLVLDAISLGVLDYWIVLFRNRQSTKFCSL